MRFVDGEGGDEAVERDGRNRIEDGWAIGTAKRGLADLEQDGFVTAAAFADDRALRRGAVSMRSAQGQAAFAFLAVTTGIGGIELDCGPAAGFMAEDEFREDDPNGEEKMKQDENSGGRPL